MPGRLLLVPTPLDFGTDAQVPLAHVLPDATLHAASRLGHWITENAKSTRAFLKRVHETHPLAQPLQSLVVQELPREVHKKGDHDPGGFDARPLLAAALDGHDIGLASEAGMPAVADPGASVVRAAHLLGLDVVPLVGPVSLLLALAASGLNGQNFAFLGYLPQQPGPRLQRLRELEALALRTGQTQLFIETPYRNPALWQSMLEALRPDTTLAVASGLTLPTGSVRSRKVAAWKKEPVPVTAATPAVFLLGR
ncbi:MAG: SAM-dependent methyltransferase [Ramlibacter sp.]